MKKFKYLLLIMLATFMSVTSVDAKGTTSTPIFWSVTASAYNNTIWTGNDTTTKNGIVFGHGVVHSAELLWRYAIDFDNNISNYDYISFYVNDENVLIQNGIMHNNSGLIPPLVMLNRVNCSVTPIGSYMVTDSNVSNNSIYHAICPVYAKSTGINSLEIISNTNASLGSARVFMGIEQYFTPHYSNDTLSDIYQEQQKTNEELGNLNDNITSSDTTESESQASGFFEDFESDDYGLSDIVTMPLTFIKSLTSNTCNTLTLQVPFVNKTLTLPCMSSIYSQYFGSFFTIYQTVTFGFIAYWVVVKIFALVKGFKDPDDDKVEVLDL